MLGDRGLPLSFHALIRGCKHEETRIAYCAGYRAGLS